MNDSGRRVIRLLWSPRDLAGAALAVPTLGAICIGFVSWTLMAGLLLGVIGAGIGEPYPSAGVYLAAALRSVAAALLVGASLSGILWLSIGFFACLWASDRRYRADLVGIRALALCGLPVLVPMLVWAPLAILAAPANSTSLDVIAPLPGVMTSSIVRVLGSGWWVLLLVGIAAMVWVRALARITTMIAAEQGCPACGYDLRGLPSRTCPECGHTPPDRLEGA